MILKVNNLTVKFLSNKQENDVVRKISFHTIFGEITIKF